MLQVYLKIGEYKFDAVSAFYSPGLTIGKMTTKNDMTEASTEMFKTTTNRSLIGPNKL